MSVASKAPTGPKPSANTTPAVVNAYEVYVWEELQKRLRWKKHSGRQARRMGLRVVRFGSRNYCLGADVLRFFELLAAQQCEEK